MRLWHYKLIPVLPNAMLVSQWREGTLKHRLVSYVMKYDKGYFKNYVNKIIDEMINRDIHYNQDFVYEFAEFYRDGINSKYYIYEEHNTRYLKQCLYNLQEKADRGIITKEEWQKIEDKFGGIM